MQLASGCAAYARQAEESIIEHGPRRAHAGIMAAATAIWKDLRAHRILPALLNRADGESDDEANPEYDIGAGVVLTDCIFLYSLCLVFLFWGFTGEMCIAFQQAFKGATQT